MRPAVVFCCFFFCLPWIACQTESGSSVPVASEIPIKTSWIPANFHAHTSSDLVKDDGEESPFHLHQTMQARGLLFSLHSVHSTFRGTLADSFLRQKKKEEALSIDGLTISVGEELTVANGPHFKSKRTTLGISIPTNLNHVSVLGIHTYIPNGTSLGEACSEAHRQGGVCIINHPGPGPMMWEEDLWEQPSHRHLIDGIEVYNGMAIAGFGKDFEERYLEASAYSGLGMHVAATASADTHGPDSVKHARDRLGSLKRWAEWFGIIPHLSGKERPELDAYTLVAAQSASETDVLRGLQQRKTIAVYDMGGLLIECPQLGNVLHTGQVSLDIQFSTPLDELSLYKEGKQVHKWTHTARASFQERVTAKTAYVFIGKRGNGRLTTSAVWYEP